MLLENLEMTNNKKPRMENKYFKIAIAYQRLLIDLHIFFPRVSLDDL